MRRTRIGFGIHNCCFFLTILALWLVVPAFGQAPSQPGLLPDYIAAETLFKRAQSLAHDGSPQAKREAINAFKSAADIYRRLQSKSDETFALIGEGLNHRDLGENESALECFEQASIAATASGDARTEGRALYFLGDFLTNRGNNRKAIGYLEKAIAVLRQSGYSGQEADALESLGWTYIRIGNYDTAKKCIERSLEIRRKADDKGGIATSTNFLGQVYDGLGEYQKALEYYQQALAGFEQVKDKYGESAALNSIGESYSQFGRYESALEYFKRSLAIARSLDDANAQAAAFNNIGRLYKDIGQLKEALESQSQALALRRQVGDRSGEAVALLNLGTIHHDSGELKQAREYYLAAMPLLRQVDDRDNEAIALNNLGKLFIDLNDCEAATTYLNQAINEYRKLPTRGADAYALKNLGICQSVAGKFDLAIETIFQSLVSMRLSKDAKGEVMALDQLRSVAAQKQNRRLAILFGKQAVNKYQEIRSSVNRLGKPARDAYLNKIRASYTALAELLIADGRLPEARAVIAMLKEEEVFDYVSRDATEVDALSRRSDLRDDEKQALAKYDDLVLKIAALGGEFAKLQQTKNALPDGQELPENDRKRFEELADQLAKANTVFQVFLRNLSEEYARKPTIVAEIQENIGLQTDLSSWGTGVVALYTVASEERYRVILTTPEVQVDGKSEIKAAELNKKIAAFRAAVQDPHVDPRPLGKELYDILVKPIEKHLEDSHAKTLLWSLDGSLRYLPLAALWDGKEYFGQKYQNVLITLASRTRLSEEPNRDWRILGLGVTAAKQLAEPDGTRMMSFSALPSVRKELSSIVNDERSVGGVISGKTLIDQEFNERSLKDRLAQRFKVVHIASHFSFRPGDMTKSFLLLGDGTALTMDKFKTSPQLKFSGVELLTLSACDTASGETDANGKEVESFAVIAQQNGAKAVLATLWPVADESTAAFMAEFYRIKTKSPEMTKAEAIRLTQKEMIDGKIKATGQNGSCRSDNFVTPGKQNDFKCDPNAPFSHPYFWSPFVLIGNWR
ncbi:MAG: hypothetical protein DMF62_01490 [Acidobacteria bacterium]|nr:MAG: hypothetical protein DMF62_01490 [Acidobacteriota bacterium]